MMLTQQLKLTCYKVLAATGLPRRLHGAFYRDQSAVLMYHGIIDRPLPVAD